MALCHTNTGLGSVSPRRIGISVVVCFLAAFFVWGEAYHIAGHDHDDHETDIDVECGVCILAALHATKISPDIPMVKAPMALSEEDQLFDQPSIAFSLKATPHLARGPPVLASAYS